MKKQKIFAWIASAFATIAVALVLAGCPHNGMISVDSESTGNSTTGGRSGKGNVTLIVTNFTPEGNQSILRTIAPEHIDLTDEDEKDKFVFVAKGTGNGTFGPEFIDIDGTGTTSLNISGGGVWSIKVEAYDWSKFQSLAAQGVNIQGNTASEITTGQHKEANLQAMIDGGQVKDVVKDAALVLSGEATVDLDGGAAVTLTLTNDTVTSPGGVDIAIVFKTQADTDAIFPTVGNSTWKVEAELVDLTTQTTVKATDGTTSKMTLWDKTAGASTDSDPGQGGYTYSKYDGAQSTYQDMVLKTNDGAVKKLLQYKPIDKGTQSLLQFPKGKYQLRVTLTNTDPNNPTTLYWADPAFYVDGNRITQGEAVITDLLGTEPSAVGIFDVYWTTPTTKDQLEGYDAIFTWTSSSYNAVGYELELADITKWYNYKNQNNQLEGFPRNGGNATDVTFADAEELWRELDGLSEDEKKNVITPLSWQDTPQKHLNIPRWKAGNLLGGSTQLTLRLSSGHVYSARIRATNGSKPSNWTEIGDEDPTGTKPNQPADADGEFDAPETHGIFDLMKIAYVLKTTDMYTLNADRSQIVLPTTSPQLDTAGDKKVENEELLQVEEYTPGTDVYLKYGFDKDHSDGSDTVANTVQTFGAKGEPWTKAQALTKKDATGKADIVTSWSGWKNTKPGGDGEIFGPAFGTAPDPAAGWKKSDWKYSDFKDLDLEPVGAGGSSIKIQAETAGTLNILDLEKIGFSFTDTPDGNTNGKPLASLNQYQGGGQGTANIYRNGAGSKLVIVLDRAKTPTDQDAAKVYIGVGEKNAGNVITNTLKDKNGNPIVVSTLDVTIEKGSSLSAYKTSGNFTPVAGDAPAYTSFGGTATTSLQGMGSGDYILRVQMTTGQGYKQSIQIPLVILYTDQVQTTTNIN